MEDKRYDLKTEWVNISEIKPYLNNAKRHPPEQIEQIKRSILKYGFADPIATWHGEIVEGHGRYIAAQELGMTEIPIHRLDEMTDEERREYMLVHNQTTLNSGYDNFLLEQTIESLPNFDAEFYGFDLTPPDLSGLDDFFSPADGDEKEPKKIKCPHCGEWFTP